jgi:hypothetical protein
MTGYFHKIYQIDKMAIFQNKMCDSKEKAISCLKGDGDIRIVEDPETGLVYNAVFSSELMVYDGNYQNEQAVSLFFQ